VYATIREVQQIPVRGRLPEFKFEQKHQPQGNVRTNWAVLRDNVHPHLTNTLSGKRLEVTEYGLQTLHNFQCDMRFFITSYVQKALSVSDCSHSCLPVDSSIL
jgi:hypothetical protein